MRYKKPLLILCQKWLCVAYVIDFMQMLCYNSLDDKLGFVAVIPHHKSFGRAFSKARRVKGQRPLSPSADGEIPHHLKALKGSRHRRRGGKQEFSPGRRHKPSTNNRANFSPTPPAMVNCSVNLFLRENHTQKSHS